MTATRLVGVSAPEGLTYYPQPSAPGCSPLTMIIGLCVSGNIQYTKDDDCDYMCLCFPPGSERQSAWVIRREPPKSSTKTTTL